MDNCSVGCALQASCHKKTYPSQKQALHLLESLNDDEQEIVQLRVEGEGNTVSPQFAHFTNTNFWTITQALTKLAAT